MPTGGVAQGLRKTKLCDNFYLTARCRYGQRCFFAHSLDELMPRGEGLTEAGFNYYDGVNMPPNDEAIAGTLRWAEWERSRGHSVPKWVYDMAWELFVVPWLGGLGEEAPPWRMARRMAWMARRMARTMFTRRMARWMAWVDG